MSERKKGWYWTKDIDHDHPDYWACQYWSGTVWEGASSPMVIGHRIPTPNEGWQTVPVEATEEMQARVPLTSAPDYVWKVMLATAPKPEDV